MRLRNLMQLKSQSATEMSCTRPPPLRLRGAYTVKLNMYLFNSTSTPDNMSTQHLKPTEL